MSQPVSEPVWLTLARGFIGTREIKGPAHNPVITGWLAKLGAWWRDDETPWCGVFVAQVFDQIGMVIPRHWMRARDWLTWGRPLVSPILGCVVVFKRDGGGHVGFCVGQTPTGYLMILGGNQGDEVNLRAFSRGRVLGYRWPLGQPLAMAALPVLTAQPVSESEA